MPTRQNALFARAFFSALKSAPTATQRRLLSASARTASKNESHDDNASSSTSSKRPKRPTPPNPLKLSEVTDNFLSDFPAPLESEPLEAGRKAREPKGFFKIALLKKRDRANIEAPEEVSAGQALLAKLRQRARDRGQREEFYKENGLQGKGAPHDPLETMKEITAIMEEELGIEPAEEGSSRLRGQRNVSNALDEDANASDTRDDSALEDGDASSALDDSHAPNLLGDLTPPPVTSATTPTRKSAWGAERFYESGWGKDSLRIQPNDYFDDGEEVSASDSDASGKPAFVRNGLIECLTVSKVQPVDPGFEQPPIARLAHGLDRVLFNPGVHWMRDPHSGVYNFPPYLQRLPDVREFDFERLHPYMRASRDTTLRALARKHGKTFAGSSSSLTGALAHIYRLISGEKPVDTSSLSAAFDTESAALSTSITMPETVRLMQRDGVWMVDPEASSPEVEERHILLWMGTMLEKFLTRTPEEFMQLLRTSPPPSEPPPREAYHFSQSHKLLMRGQLDCVDPRLPGSGVFDIKTRASMFVRLDRWNMEDFAGYEITRLQGRMESFEREQYDLMRSAFLKYAFQARIGDMDGCIVAYHNTVKHMGFEYFHLDAMEKLLYGKSGVGVRVFQQCVDMLERILEAVLEVFPGEDVELLFDKNETVDRLSLFVYPIKDPEDVRLLQVYTQSLLGDAVVDKPKAVLSLRADWSLKYSIVRMDMPQHQITRLHAASVRRQASVFPRAPGMTADQMRTMWRDFSPIGSRGGAAVVDPEEPVPMKFLKPSTKILSLRRLAKEGHLRIEELEKKERGLERVVHRIDPASFKSPAEREAEADTNSLGDREEPALAEKS